jgi:hypothetical protein
MTAAPATYPQTSSRPLGRPSLFTPDTCATIIDCLRRGIKRKLACAKARVAYDTFNTWLQKGADDPDSAFGRFRQEVLDAETDGKFTLVESWLDQTKRDFRAAAKYLAILDPDEYSEQRQLRIMHEGTVTHEHVHTLQLPDETHFAQLAGLLGLPDEVEGTATEVDTDP